MNHGWAKQGIFLIIHVRKLPDGIFQENLQIWIDLNFLITRGVNTEL